MITNMNTPMPHPHHAPTHPGERPHVLFNTPHSPVNHDQLANQMNQLRIQQERLSPRNERRSSRDSIASTDIDEDAATWYVGYTFFKAQPAPGHPYSWRNVDKAKINLGQGDLANLIRKRTRKMSTADQYQSLTPVKRPHVDRVIEDLQQSNPQFQWSCAYVKEETRDVKGKSFRRDYETTSMSIILVGKRTNRSFSGEPREFRDQMPGQAQRPSPQNQHRPIVGNGPYADPRSVPNISPTPMPSQMPGMQHGLAQSHQPGPDAFRLPPQNPMAALNPMAAQSPMAAQHPMATQNPMPAQNPMTVRTPIPGPQHSDYGNWTQDVTRDSLPHPPLPHPPNPRPAVHNPISQPFVAHTRPDDQEDDARRVKVDPRVQNNRNEMPHQNTTHRHQPEFHVDHRMNAKGKRIKSPKPLFGSEPDLVYDSTSSGDENPTLEYYDDDSEEEFSSREVKSNKARLLSRGGVHRGARSPSQSHHRYRTHYRKQPRRLADRGNRRYREDADIDLIPAEGVHSARSVVRTHGGGRQWGVQPRIIHQEPSSDELDVLMMNQYRGQPQNESRSRVLDNWQAELAQRENFIEYQEQRLKNTFRNDRMDDMGYMYRSRSLRDPMPAYARHYPLRALNYY